MKTGTLLICDEEKQYANLLMDYISNKKDIPFQTIMFTNMEELNNYLENHSVELLLISDSLMDDELALYDIEKIIILSEGKVSERYTGYSKIYKFKSAESIVREVLEHYIEIAKDETSLVVQKGDVKIIGVYSPVGRSGKTTFAITLAEVLSECHKTLFISFEEFAVFQNDMEVTSIGNLADLMYYFKQNPDTAAIKLQAITQKINSLDYVAPIYYARDLRDIETKEWIELLENISSSNNYEYVVLDIGDMLGDVLSMLDYCDEIYMPTIDDKLSEMKINKIENVILQSDRETLLNKIIKTKVPKLESNYLQEHWIETLGISNVGDYARALIKREENEY